MAPVISIFSVWLVAAIAAGLVLRRTWMRQQALETIFDDEEIAAETQTTVERMWFLPRWLFLAGYRSPRALPIFVAATLACAGAGLFVVYIAARQGAVALMTNLLIAVPGGVGEVFLPLAWCSPWLTVGLIGLMPTMVVRAARRRRVQEVEQDLPVTLDLLASLAEAGLGFDTAVDRILATQPRTRALAAELRMFQLDLMAGRPRIEALRRLSRRLEVPWFTVFISAVVQAERVGAGLASVLRIQADDLRNRRRERALAHAMSLPAKMTLPLVACFLPGIAVVVLGPTFYQVFQILDNLFRQ